MKLISTKFFPVVLHAVCIMSAAFLVFMAALLFFNDFMR